MGYKIKEIPVKEWDEGIESKVKIKNTIKDYLKSIRRMREDIKKINID